MIASRITFSFIILFITFCSQAQSRYQKYDSIFYERSFSPALVTLMMPKGYVEVVFQQALSTANQFYSNNREKADANGRYTYYYFITRTNTGVSESSNVNAGMDFYYIQARHDAYRNSSPFNVFDKSSPGNIQSGGGLTAIAPRLKIIPKQKNKNLIYQTSLIIPVMKRGDERKFLGQDKLAWSNEVLYNFIRTKHFTGFLQGSVTTYFQKANGKNTNQYIMPINVYGYYTLTKYVFPFASAGYSIGFRNQEGLKKSFDYLPVGVGVQFQFSLRFNANLFYSQPIIGDSYLHLRTLSLGIRTVF